MNNGQALKKGVTLGENIYVLVFVLGPLNPPLYILNCFFSVFSSSFPRP